MPVLKGVYQIGELADFRAGRLPELRNISRVRLRIFDCVGFVGAESRQDFYLEIFGTQFFVRGEVGNRVVRSADRLDPRTAHTFAGGKPAAQNGIGSVPNFVGGFGGKEEVVDSEKPRHLNMRPMVNRIAQ